MSEAESREMERIEPEDMDHVTLAATVDTSDLSPPRCNWIIQQAEKVEQRFKRYIGNKESATVGDCPDRDFIQMYEDSHGIELVADVSDCGPDAVENIQSATDTLEDWFVRQVRQAGN